MRIIIFLFVAFLSTNVVQPQVLSGMRTDTLSTTKLIGNFKLNCQRSHSDEFQPNDRVFGFAEGGMALFAYSPLKTIMNVASGKVYAEWIIRHHDNQFQLYLKRIVPVEFSKEQAQNIYADLEKRYKKDEKYGIPAEWFTGKIKLLFCPKNLFGEIVSKTGYVLTIKGGNIIEQKEINLKEGTLEASSHPQEDGSVLIRGDGCWWSDILINTNNLNHFVNRDQSAIPKNKTEKEYSILLTTDSSSGRIHFYALLPFVLDAEDTLNVAFLKKRLEQLPAWSYGPLLTLDGRLMYGRYFKATLFNGEWRLQDYISCHN